MVNLTRIYTRTGDAGETRLSDNSVARKTDLRVRAYGDVDEANAILGIATASGELPEALQAALRTIQNELFDVGADLSNPMRPDPAWPPLRITQPSVDRLEAWCDSFGAALPDLRSFILPGGSAGSAYLHLACTIVRRAERETVTLARHEAVRSEALQYLNRLSDLLFVLARVLARADGHGEALWQPQQRQR